MLTKLLSALSDEKLAAEKQGTRDKQRFENEIQKACLEERFDAAFVEQYARDQSSDPAAFIKKAMAEVEEELRREQVQTEIDELETQKSSVASEIREHAEAKGEAEAKRDRAYPYDRWHEIPAEATLEDVDAFRDLVREVSHHDDRELFARRELKRIEQNIERLQKTL